jgi:hypothetical protein
MSRNPSAFRSDEVFANDTPCKAENLRETGNTCPFTVSPRSANIPPCLVRPKNQFSLTRGALSTGGRAKSDFLSVDFLSVTA